MPTLHELMSASIDARAGTLRDADAPPGGATRGLIARRRRRNAVAAGGTSALAIGGLLAAGLTQRDRADDNAPASAEPNAIEYVDVDLSMSDVSQGFTDPVVSTNCGASLPSPTVEDQGFTQSVAVDPAAPDGTLRVNVSLGYDGPDRASALINPGSAVLTRDGVVINYYPDNNHEAPFGAVANGDTWTNRSVVSGPVFEQRPCFSGVDYVEPNPTDVAYPAGDYQVYVVSQALASTTLLAEHALQDQGYFVAGSGSGAWIPGSVDCQQWATSAGGGLSPVQCEDPLPSGVSIDTEANTATLPYHSADYSGELNVTLVSQPITVNLDHDITYADLGQSSEPASQPKPKPASLEPLACGGEANQHWDGVEASFAQIPSFADIVSGVDVPILVDAQTGRDTTKGTLHVGAHASAALIVAGNWIAQTATPVVTPTEVPINRAKGFPDVLVRLENVTACPEPTDGAQRLDTHDPGRGWLLEIRGDFRIDWEDGTSTTAKWITLSGVEQG